MIKSIFDKLSLYLSAVGVGISLLVGAWFAGRSNASNKAQSEKANERSERNAIAAKAINEASNARAKADNEVHSNRGGSSVERLRNEWNSDR